MAAAAISDNFEWLYFRNGSQSTYIERGHLCDSTAFLFERYVRTVTYSILAYAYPRALSLTSSFCIWWYHLILNNFRWHHWSRASVFFASLLVTAQHYELYRKIGSMQVFYRFSLVEMEILDCQIWLSRFCLAAQVMAMQHATWDTRGASSWVDNGAKIDKFFNYCNLLPWTVIVNGSSSLLTKAWT